MKAVNDDTVTAKNKNKIFLKRYLVCFLEILTGAVCIKSQYLTEFLRRLLVECVREIRGLSHCFPTVNKFA